MPRGVYDRSKKNKPTPTEKVKKVYRTKTSSPKLVSAGAGEVTIPSHSMGGFQNLISYYHALVVSKTQGVNSKVLDQEILDTVDQLRVLRIELYGTTQAEKAETPVAKIPVQEVAPEVPQQAVFTPPA